MIKLNIFNKQFSNSRDSDNDNINISRITKVNNDSETKFIKNGSKDDKISNSIKKICYEICPNDNIISKNKYEYKNISIKTPNE